MTNSAGEDAAPESARHVAQPAEAVRDRRTANRRLLAFAGLVVTLEAVVFLFPLGGQVTPFALVVIPAAAGVIVSARAGGAPAVRVLVRRLAGWRVRPRWYAAALLIPVAEKVIIDIVGLLLGRTTPSLLVSALTTAAVIVPAVVFAPALLEELGWRGYAVQTAIDGGRSAAWATLVVGCLFFLCHVPLYLPGHIYHGMPSWPLPLTLLSSSVFLTWIYLRTGSVLLTGLMHASFNASVPLTWGLDPTWVWEARAVVLTMLAAALVVGIRRRAIGQRPQPEVSERQSEWS